MQYVDYKGFIVMCMRCDQMAHSWIWIGRERQKEIISRCSKYMDKVVDVVENLDVMVTSYCEGKVDSALEAYRKVVESEEEADRFRRALFDEVSRGVFHAIDRDEMLRLILSLDDIANAAKASARRFYLILNKAIQRILSGYCMRMCRHSVEAAHLVKSAVEELTSNPRRALEIADKVERIEEEVDELALKALENLLEKSKELDPSLVVIVKDVIESIERITDKCEDSMDVIRRIAIVLM